MSDRIAERLCDMRSGHKLQVFKSGADGDIQVSVLKTGHLFSRENVEFCVSGSQSPNTRRALMALLEAMEEDEELYAQKDTIKEFKDKTRKR